MPEPTEACVLCGADRTTAVIVLSSKSGFTRWVCASPGGCRHRRQVKAAYVEGRRQAALEIVAVEEAGEEKGEGYWAARSIAEGGERPAKPTNPVDVRVDHDPITGETRVYQNSGAAITILSGSWTTVRWSW